MAIINLKEKIHLTESDIDAILSALPLVELAHTDTLQQAALNGFCCDAVRAKLCRHDAAMTPNEYRVVYAAVGIALDVINGNPLDYLYADEIDPAWKADLSKCFFTYNRLYPQFGKIVDRFYK